MMASMRFYVSSCHLSPLCTLVNQDPESILDECNCGYVATLLGWPCLENVMSTSSKAEGNHMNEDIPTVHILISQFCVLYLCRSRGAYI